MQPGRLYLKEELTTIPKGTPDLATFSVVENQYYCQRCFSLVDANWFSFPNDKQKTIYCPYCSQLGLVTKENGFYYEKAQLKDPQKVLLSYPHPLSKEQQELSQWLKETIAKNPPRVLLWAVTGAGKTEMTFACLKQALEKGERVAWCSPRVDVCLEIAPRLKKSLPKVSQVILHGTSETTYEREQLVIATTHQLLRFYQHFSLIIIDEVDAFPFVNNPVLEKGIQKAITSSGSFLYLTATPTKQLLKAMRKQQLPFRILSHRFHGRPLAIPEFLWLKNWREQLLKKLSNPLKQLLASKRWLLFCPDIQWMVAFEKILQETFPKKKITSVSSKDPKRHEKVQKLREEEYDLVCTTTILERGVTLKDIQVLVIGSNEQIFQKETLIQISGRVGRHHDFPEGHLFFLHDGKTKAMVQAKKEIQQLNEISKKGSFIQ